MRGREELGDTMNVLVVGGQLQGTEIVCLAKEAGWEVTVVDKKQAALASYLCDHFYCVDVLLLGQEFFSAYDLVFPATENLETLRFIKEKTTAVGVPFVFDEAAYVLSRSKVQTNRFLQDIHVTIPPMIEDFLLCSNGNDQGYIVKPDCSSGSKGVRRFSDRSVAYNYINDHPDCFGQIFLEGPVLSIEAVCKKGEVTPYLVTEVVINSVYDCKRIVAPAAVSEEVKEAVRELAVTIGKALNMTGLFDLEMIYHQNHLYVLEIDARIPSQTPLATYYATGVNLVVETARCFVDSLTLPPKAQEVACARSTVLQHVRIQQGHLDFIGECELVESLPLSKFTDSPHLDMMLMSEENSTGERYATLISTEDNYLDALRKLTEVATPMASQEISHDEIINKQYCLH